MIYSEMDISLIYSRVIVVNIVGEVYNPGSYTIPAINTKFNALMVALTDQLRLVLSVIYISKEMEIL